MIRSRQAKKRTRCTYIQTAYRATPVACLAGPGAVAVGVGVPLCPVRAGRAGRAGRGGLFLVRPGASRAIKSFAAKAVLPARARGLVGARRLAAAVRVVALIHGHWRSGVGGTVRKQPALETQAVPAEVAGFTRAAGARGFIRPVPAGETVRARATAGLRVLVGCPVALCARLGRSVASACVGIVFCVGTADASLDVHCGIAITGGAPVGQSWARVLGASWYAWLTGLRVLESETRAGFEVLVFAHGARVVGQAVHTRVCLSCSVDVFALPTVEAAHVSCTGVVL